MCNLYSITTNQAAIIALFRVVNRYVGNLPPMPGVFPDYPAPIIRNAGADRELTMMCWHAAAAEVAVANQCRISVIRGRPHFGQRWSQILTEFASLTNNLRFAN
jgi:putative SOS response-associated peptidase YedK